MLLKENCKYLLRDVDYLIKDENCTEENKGQYIGEASRPLRYRINKQSSAIKK